MNQESKNFFKKNRPLLISILLLTILFAFNDKQPDFIFSNWISNFFSTLLLVAAVLLCNYLGLKVAGHFLDEDITPKIFGSHRFSRLIKQKHKEEGVQTTTLKTISSIFLTPILPFLVMLISNGTFIIPAVYTFGRKIKRKIGREIIHLEERQLSFIAITSIIFNIVLLVIFKFFGITEGVTTSSLFIFWNLLPFSDLLGSKIFFGTKTIYILFFIFSILFILLIHLISLWALIPALIIAATLTFWYFTKFEVS